jgi:hypothetical protein
MTKTANGRSEQVWEFNCRLEAFVQSTTWVLQIGNRGRDSKVEVRNAGQNSRKFDQWYG